MATSPRLNQYSVSARNAAAIARAAAAVGGGSVYHESPQPGADSASRSHWEWAFQALEKRHKEVVTENEQLYAENQKLTAQLRDAHATITHMLSQGQPRARPNGESTLQYEEPGPYVMRRAGRESGEEMHVPPLAATDDDDRALVQPTGGTEVGGGGGGLRRLGANLGIGAQSQASPRHGRRAGQAPPAPPAEQPPAEPNAPVQDPGLDFAAFKQIVAEHDPKFYSEAQLAARFEEMGGAHGGGGGVDEGDLRLRLFLEALGKKAPKVIAWLRTYDTNNDQKIDRREFKKACKELGLDNGLMDLGAAFDALDEDGSGVLTYKELNERLKPSTVAKNKFRSAGRAAMAVGGGKRMGGASGGLTFTGVKLQEGMPIAAQLATVLNENSARVIDLFRRMDTDGNGEVTRKELRGALVEFGLDVSDDDLSALWRELDPNGDGAVTIREMTAALRASAVRATEQVKKTAMGAKLKAVAAFSKSGWA
jgi:Ca2+-binding EF-hand superfamily protein